MWGWGLYHYRFKKKYHPINLLWFLGKILLNKIPELITDIEENYVLAEKKYNINDDYKFAFYPNPVIFQIFQMFDLNRKKDSDTENDIIKILVENSADQRNNHLEIFEVLKCF